MKAFYRLFYYFSILLTGVLAGVTLVGAFAGNTTPESFKLIPFIGLGSVSYTHLTLPTN